MEKKKENVGTRQPDSPWLSISIGTRIPNTAKFTAISRNSIALFFFFFFQLLSFSSFLPSSAFFDFLFALRVWNSAKPVALSHWLDLLSCLNWVAQLRTAEDQFVSRRNIFGKWSERTCKLLSSILFYDEILPSRSLRGASANTDGPLSHLDSSISLYSPGVFFSFYRKWRKTSYEIRAWMKFVN